MARARTKTIKTDILARVEGVPLALRRTRSAGIDGELGVAALDEVDRVGPGERGLDLLRLALHLDLAALERFERGARCALGGLGLVIVALGDQPLLEE